MSTSQNGWTVVPAGATPETTPSGQPRCRRFVLPGITSQLWLRDGVAGLLLADLLVTFNKIERLSGTTLDDWGYALREIRGDDSGYSNHASGTAVDANAMQHPLGASGTFTRAQAWRIRRMLRRRYKGVVRWGGDYNGRKDEMHFEINASHDAVRKVCVSLIKTRRMRSILDANPGLRSVIH